jgi:hypothetical protein
MCELDYAGSGYGRTVGLCWDSCVLSGCLKAGVYSSAEQLCVRACARARACVCV